MKIKLKPSCSKIWAIHRSKKKKRNYYYNIITKKSFWERPPNISEDDIINSKDILNEIQTKCDSKSEINLLESTKSGAKEIPKTGYKPNSKREDQNSKVDLFNDTSCNKNDVPSITPTNRSKSSIDVVKNNSKPILDNKSKRIKLKAKKRKQRKKSKARITDSYPPVKESNMTKNISHDIQKPKTTDGEICAINEEQAQSKVKFRFKDRKKIVASNSIVKNIKSQTKMLETCKDSASLLPQKLECSLGKSNALVGNESKEELNYSSSSQSLSSLCSYSDEELSPNIEHSPKDTNSFFGNNDNIIFDQSNSPSSSEVSMPSSPLLYSQTNNDERNKFMSRMLFGNSIDSTSCNQDDEVEEMDWEVSLTDYELIKDIVDVRKEVCSYSNQLLRNEEALMEICEDSPLSHSTEDTFIVVDTNVFISNLELVRNMIDIKLSDDRRIIIVVPWQVLQELDKLKAHNRKSIGFKCRKAIDFIHTNLQSSDKRVIAQSIKMHFMKTNLITHYEMEDDAILNCSIQLFEQNKKVVLYTHDKNLLNKAYASGIGTISPKQLSEGLDADKNAWIDSNINRFNTGKSIEKENNTSKQSYKWKGSLDSYYFSNSTLSRISPLNSPTENVNDSNLSFKNCSKSILSKRKRINKETKESRNLVNKELPNLINDSRKSRLYKTPPKNENSSFIFSSKYSELTGEDIISRFQNCTDKLLTDDTEKSFNDEYSQTNSSFGESSFNIIRSAIK